VIPLNMRFKILICPSTWLIVPTCDKTHPNVLDLGQR
jgi:hypothetical protein